MPKAVEVPYRCLIYSAQKQITVPVSLFASILFMLQYEMYSVSDLFIWKKKLWPKWITFRKRLLLKTVHILSCLCLLYAAVTYFSLYHTRLTENLNKNGTVNKFSLKWCQSFEHSFERKTNVSYWGYAANRSSPWRASLRIWYLLFPVTLMNECCAFLFSDCFFWFLTVILIIIFYGFEGISLSLPLTVVGIMQIMKS